jgi:hypothetical protein
MYLHLFLSVMESHIEQARETKRPGLAFLTALDILRPPREFILRVCSGLTLSFRFRLSLPGHSIVHGVVYEYEEA